MKPLTPKCGRCGTPKTVFLNAITVDNKPHDLCGDCWKALHEWLAAGSRAKSSGGEAA